MKKYYCIVVFGDITNIHKILQSVISGKLFFVNYGGIFIATFESDFSTGEIDDILYVYKKCFILTKMLNNSFRGYMVDGDIQGHLFADYFYKSSINNKNKYKDNNDLGSIEVPGFDTNIPEDLGNIPIDDYVNMFGDDQPEFGDLNIYPKNLDNYNPTIDDIDALLEKINKVGFDKLNQEEKKILEKYSKL